MIHGHTLGLVIPAHNEEDGLPRVCELIPPEVDSVLVVDNCSTDDTALVARGYGARVVSQPLKGYGSAYKAGFRAVTTDIVSTLDADGTYPVDRIPLLAEALLSRNLDFISARRIPDDHAGTLNNAMRFSGNWILTGFTMLLFWKKIMDSQSGMWVFKRDILPRLELTSNGMAFSEELKIEAWNCRDLRCAEVSVPFRYSDRIGTPKINLWRDGFRNLLFLFAKRFGISMTKA